MDGQASASSASNGKFTNGGSGSTSPTRTKIRPGPLSSTLESLSTPVPLTATTPTTVGASTSRHIDEPNPFDYLAENYNQREASPPQNQDADDKGVKLVPPSPHPLPGKYHLSTPRVSLKDSSGDATPHGMLTPVAATTFLSTPSSTFNPTMPADLQAKLGKLSLTRQNEIPEHGSDLQTKTTGAAMPTSSVGLSAVTAPQGAISARRVPPGVVHNPGASTPSPQTAPKGRMTIKLISGKNLSTRSVTNSRPYVVVQFEQSEFVSREAMGAPEAGSTGHGGSHARSDSYGRGFDASNPVWKHEVSFDSAQETSPVFISVYDRSMETEGFLGIVEVHPQYTSSTTIDRWCKLQPRETTDVVSGEIRVQVGYERLEKTSLTPKDFEVLKLIGRGTFGRVFQVRKRDTRRIYAMKVLSKREIVAKKEIAHTIGERKILQRSLECPFLVGLKFSFQTETELYFVTDYKSGGELFWHLQREGRFSEDRARFYIAELVLALEHLHKYDIVYRDLKPENILLDATGHIALCDFGLSKPDLPSDALTNTFCGTTEYLAPEVLLDDHGYTKMVDFWSLGVLLFEMCCGWSPFYAEDTQQMYKNICFGKIRFPRGVISEDGKQFVKGLLNRNAKHRLGAHRDAAELKQHPFLSAIDWEALASRQLTPPFKPSVDSDESVANFDPEFTTADIRSSGVDLGSYDDPSFGRFSFSAEDESSSDSTGDGFPRSRRTHSNDDSTSSAGSGLPISSKKAAKDSAPPLSKSVQDNFRGFTYSGESVLENAANSFLKRNGSTGRGNRGQLAMTARVDESEEDRDDDSAPMGRLARERAAAQEAGIDL